MDQLCNVNGVKRKADWSLSSDPTKKSKTNGHDFFTSSPVDLGSSIDAELPYVFSYEFSDEVYDSSSPVQEIKDSLDANQEETIAANISGEDGFIGQPVSIFNTNLNSPPAQSLNNFVYPTNITEPVPYDVASSTNPSFTVAIPRQTRGRPKDDALIAISIPYNEVVESPRTVLWLILDAENATMEVVRNGRPCKEKKEGPFTYQAPEKTYSLYKWSPQHDQYRIRWLVNRTEVLSADMKFTPKSERSKSVDSQIIQQTDIVPKRQEVLRTVAQFSANQTLPHSSAELLPASSINVLFVVADDNLFHQLTMALRDLDFQMQINCDQGQLCLYTRRGRIDDNIVVLKYSAPKHLKVITECNDLVEEMLFLLPSTNATVSISSFSGNSRPLEVKKFEDNLAVEAAINELPRYFAQAVRHALDCCRNVKIGAAFFNPPTPEEISCYLASWIARCAPMHRKNIDLLFNKHTSSEATFMKSLVKSKQEMIATSPTGHDNAHSTCIKVHRLKEWVASFSRELHKISSNCRSSYRRLGVKAFAVLIAVAS